MTEPLNTPTCPSCGAKLGFPTDKNVRLTCPTCGARMEWAPGTGFKGSTSAATEAAAVGSSSENTPNDGRGRFHRAGATLLWYSFGVLIPVTIAFVGFPEDNLLSGIDSMTQDTVQGLHAIALLMSVGIAWRLGALRAWFASLVIGAGAGTEGVPVDALPVVLLGTAALITMVGFVTPLRDPVKMGAFAMTGAGLMLAFLYPDFQFPLPGSHRGLSTEDAMETAPQLTAEGETETALNSLSAEGVSAVSPIRLYDRGREIGTITAWGTHAVWDYVYGNNTIYYADRGAENQNGLAEPKVIAEFPRDVWVKAIAVAAEHASEPLAIIRTVAPGAANGSDLHSLFVWNGDLQGITSGTNASGGPSSIGRTITGEGFVTMAGGNGLSILDWRAGPLVRIADFQHPNLPVAAHPFLGAARAGNQWLLVTRDAATEMVGMSGNLLGVYGTTVVWRGTGGAAGNGLYLSQGGRTVQVADGLSNISSLTTHASGLYATWAYEGDIYWYDGYTGTPNRVTTDGRNATPFVSTNDLVWVRESTSAKGGALMHARGRGDPVVVFEGVDRIVRFDGSDIVYTRGGSVGFWRLDTPPPNR
jgi:hypothetical protein